MDGSMPGTGAPIGAFVLLLSTLYALPAGAQLVAVSQTRSVEVAVETEDATFSSCVPLLEPSCTPDTIVTDTLGDADAATDFGPFAATVSVPSFPATSAQQSSEISAGGITAGGAHAAVSTFTNSGGFPVTLHGETHETGTRLEVEFSLAEAAAYTLTGSVTTSGGISSNSSARLSLLGPSGPLGEVEVVSDPDCADPGCFTVGPRPLALAGQLPPGTYTLEAVAVGTASGQHSTSGSFGGTHAGSFEVDLALGHEVPALPGWAPPALALALAAGGGLARAARRP